MTQHEHPEPPSDRSRCDCGAPATRRSRDTREYACDTCRPAWMWIADPVALSTEDDGLAGLRAKLDALVARRREEKTRMGWRSRAPTAEEARAHAMAHPARPGGKEGWWMVRAPNGTLETLKTGGQPPHETVARVLMERYHWRPLTVDGDPALWPEVTT